MGVLAIFLALMVTLTTGVQNLWRQGSDRSTTFSNAQAGMVTLRQTIAQATLHTYFDYPADDGEGNAENLSENAGRQPSSALHFISGPVAQVMSNTGAVSSSGKASPVTHAIFFQAPLGYTAPDSDYYGLSGLLNTTGFYIVYGPDSDYDPEFRPAQTTDDMLRYRLMQVLVPTEEMGVIDSTSQAGYNRQWLDDIDVRPQGGRTHVVAENIVALVILPKLPVEYDLEGDDLAPQYLYDSRSWLTESPANPKTPPETGLDLELAVKDSLPPMIELILVAVDETSVRRAQEDDSLSPRSLKLNELFQDAGKIEEDLNTLKARLTQADANHRVLRSEIGLPNALPLDPPAALSSEEIPDLDVAELQ